MVHRNNGARAAGLPLVEVAGREDELVPGDRLPPKTGFYCLRIHQFRKRPNPETLGSGDAAIVLERLFARGF